jgi:hypothetical protein
MKFLLDEHIDPAIARGLLRLDPSVEVLEVRQVMPGTPDPGLLEWAAHNGYILVTRDVNTLVGDAYERIEAGIHTEGVLVTRWNASIGEVVRELWLIVRNSHSDEWANQVTYIPL